MSHFDNKIKLVPTTTNQQLQDEQSIHVLEPATEEEIRRIVMKSLNKSCEVDPVPTWLLKCCLTEFPKYIICNFNAVRRSRCNSQNMYYTLSPCTVCIKNDI